MDTTSLHDVRIDDVLDAFMHCIAHYGVEGSTLAKISDAAGVPRPLLRYYFGNREQMVIRLLDHAVTEFNTMTDHMLAALPETGRLAAMMDWLFDENDMSFEPPAVFQALVTASLQHKGIRERLLEHLHKFEQAIAAELMREFPQASMSDCEIVAAGIAATCWNVEAVMPVKPPAQWTRKQRLAAERLIDGLRG